METGAIIALGSLLVAFIALLVSARRDTRGEAASQAQVNAKLDSIAGGVDDIRVEQRAMRERLDGYAERLARVKSSVKSAQRHIIRLTARRADESDAKAKEVNEMKINWLVRVKNKAFWAALIPAVLLLVQAVAALIGVSIDLGEIGDKLLQVVNAIFTVLAILGIVTDPTTTGTGDSERALTYTQPWTDDDGIQ